MNNHQQTRQETSTQVEQSEEKNFQQWHRFIREHGFMWKGTLSRYDGEGRLIKVLNSTRKFTPRSDASEIEHYLYFINRDDPSKVYERQWTLEKCEPSVIHPIDPESTIMFSSYLSGVMSRPHRKNNVSYAEIYLNEGNCRMSTVITYHPEDSPETNNKCTLANISLFREVKLEESPFPWSSEKHEITTREYPRVQVINSSMLRFGTFDEIAVSNDVYDWLEEDRLILDFPDGISLNLPKTFGPGDKDNLILSWRYSRDRIKRAIAQFSDDTRGPDLITQECMLL
ncbi:MAG: DUF3598 family protein [Rhizonema sp. PD37]|nr:DUF3598 family protein [Rhizonema sp. PD37]